MNQVTKKEEGALAVNIFEADADKGSQNMTQDDLALPFLKVLGQLSPEINKRDGKYVEGAEPGMILNTVTNEIFDGTKGINVLPVMVTYKSYLVLKISTSIITLNRVSYLWNLKVVRLLKFGR